MSHGAAFLMRTTATISSHPLPSGSGEGLREAAALPKASGPNANVGTEAANPGSSGTVHGRGWGSGSQTSRKSEGDAEASNRWREPFYSGSIATGNPARKNPNHGEHNFRRSGARGARLLPSTSGRDPASRGSSPPPLGGQRPGPGSGVRLREVSEAGQVGGARGPEKLALESGTGVAAPARAARRWASDRRRPQGWASGCEVRALAAPGLSPAGNAGPEGGRRRGGWVGPRCLRGPALPGLGIRAPRRRVAGGGAGERSRGLREDAVPWVTQSCLGGDCSAWDHGVARGRGAGSGAPRGCPPCPPPLWGALRRTRFPSWRWLASPPLGAGGACLVRCLSSCAPARGGHSPGESVDSSLGGLSRSSTVASLDTDSTKSSGQSNTNSDACAEFRIRYVGAIEKLKPSEGESLEGPLDLINYIDVAQVKTEKSSSYKILESQLMAVEKDIACPQAGYITQDGKLPFVPLEEEFIMGVSKYGIKVSTSDQYDVLHRHALYLIIRMVCYDDGLGAGKSLLALKTTDARSEEVSLWVYQCSSLWPFQRPQSCHHARRSQEHGREHVGRAVGQAGNAEQAQAICKVLSTAFDSVLTAEKAEAISREVYDFSSDKSHIHESYAQQYHHTVDWKIGPRCLYLSLTP
ncbi:hypothetical protein QTO34_006841 [Cnephaeus nilssonii]|uniref:Integrin beta-1-binding protein 1 n=1 Tax=Cnephaeus nilssonii TaxID=3371016 RepID=A0AA40LHT4_CNENI|nr:hypothetical protein QTO34_006841 [Eptesicus nilssonii]